MVLRDQPFQMNAVLFRYDLTSIQFTGLQLLGILLW